ncbi:hypothetical protein GBC99_09970 [Bifidobacterium longum]|nr:hypothetical protein GBC99_09970 [Bifidobacterium longum]
MLVYLLHECPDQLAADMRRVYGLGIYELDPLETAVLAVRLPAGSLIWQKLDVPMAWTLDQYLAAVRIDQMNMWMWGNSDPKKRGPRPEPLPRPGNGATVSAANPSQPADADTAKARTIKPMGLTIEQLDAFMSRDFTDVETKPFTHNE